jgi:hypothetical protein
LLGARKKLKIKNFLFSDDGLSGYKPAQRSFGGIEVWRSS